MLQPMHIQPLEVHKFKDKNGELKFSEIELDKLALVLLPSTPKFLADDLITRKDSNQREKNRICLEETFRRD